MLRSLCAALALTGCATTRSEAPVLNAIPSQDQAVATVATPALVAAVAPAPAPALTTADTPAPPPTEAAPTPQQPAAGMILPLEAAVPVGGMALAPALVLVRPIPLGVHVDLAAAGIPFQIENRSAEEMALSLVATDPRQAGIAGWEAGFEAPPNMSWFHIEPSECVVPPRSRLLATLIVELPDRPELANRRFCVCAVLAPPAGRRIGAGLALAGRLLIETEVRDDPAAQGGMPLSLTPVMAETDGAASRTLCLRNNGATARNWKLLPISGGVHDPAKHGRYAARGTTPVEGWSTVVPAEGSLEPGAAAVIACSTAVPAGTAPGLYEELLFAVVPDAAEGGQPVCTFIRLHHRIR